MTLNQHTVPNAIRALGRFLKAIPSPEPVFASEDVIRERTHRCETCWRFDSRDRQCLTCTCFVDLKVALAPERCPASRWLEQTRFSKGL